MSDPEQVARRKKILRVLFISLLLDLISFTFILPLFPKLVDFYRTLETQQSLLSTSTSPTILSRILSALNSYKSSFARPISSRYDTVLLGGALGSLFSICQAIASPIIGKLSDTHGRRTALLWSMVGNILSVALWVAATDFRTFLASRVVGGLSEGNVQLATAIATDISDESQRGATMAMVGACFSIAFTFGPALGAALAGLTTVEKNPFATAAGFSLLLLLVETAYLYLYLPETLPSVGGVGKLRTGSEKGEKNDVNGANGSTTTATANTSAKVSNVSATERPLVRTNSHLTLSTTHLLFILFFSGMEFSLSFLSSDLFAFTPSQNGRLLGYIGLVASILQGGVTRRLHPLLSVRIGVVTASIAFFLLARVTTIRGLYIAATFLAITSATVVTGLNGLASFEASSSQRGSVLGRHRAWGQVGRTIGPLVFCTLYWWAGREVAYAVGAAGMVGVVGLVFGGLAVPKGTEIKKAVKTS